MKISHKLVLLGAYINGASEPGPKKHIQNFDSNHCCCFNSKQVRYKILLELFYYYCSNRLFDSDPPVTAAQIRNFMIIIVYDEETLKYPNQLKTSLLLTFL